MTSQTRPNAIGGFENDAFLDYKDDAFIEASHTELGHIVEICNYDLTECKTVRCIIQGNSADSQLKSMERFGLFVRGTVTTGMYVKYENRYWLVTGYPSYNGVYEKAVLQICQYKMRWQGNDGKFHERWCNITSASKYDIGESGNNTLVLTSNNYTVLMPDDKYAMELEGQRVFIDKRTVNPQKTFKLTRADDVLYDFGEEHGGLLAFIADKSELNMETDRPDLGVCDYKDASLSPTKPLVTSQPLKATMYGRNNITIGYSRKYSVKFKNAIGDEVDVLNHSWNIVCDFADKIEMAQEGGSCKITVTDRSLIGKTFKVQVIRESEVMTEKSVIIEDTY